MNTKTTIRYRVIQTITYDFAVKNIQTSTFWEGTDVGQLSRSYPPSHVFGADQLAHREMEDGCIRYDYTFQHQTEDGSWEDCSDPRRRTTPMTALERAIDAENRRLFPGDFETDDDPDDDGDPDSDYYEDDIFRDEEEDPDYPEEPDGRW